MIRTTQIIQTMIQMIIIFNFNDKLTYFLKNILLNQESIHLIIYILQSIISMKKKKKIEKISHNELITL